MICVGEVWIKGCYLNHLESTLHTSEGDVLRSQNNRGFTCHILRLCDVCHSLPSLLKLVKIQVVIERVGRRRYTHRLYWSAVGWWDMGWEGGRCTSPPLYLWFTVGGGGLGFGTVVRMPHHGQLTPFTPLLWSETGSSKVLAGHHQRLCHSPHTGTIVNVPGWIAPIGFPSCLQRPRLEFQYFPYL